MTKSASNRLLAAAGAIVAVALYTFLNFRVVLSASAGPAAGMRQAYWHDQLGYLATVTNVAGGDFSTTEPMTQTGVDHYPRAYYSLVGLVAHVTGITPVSAWNITAIVFQLTMVIALAFTAARLSRRWWMSLLAPLPFIAGTFSALRFDDWKTPLDSHAVLWGPFGQFFSNNAEGAGLSVIVIAGCALANVWLRHAHRGVRVVVTIMSVAAVGALSSFQTYSFISGIYLLAYVTAIYFLARTRSAWWWIGSGAGVILVFLAGPLVSSVAGQLPTLIFGLLPAAPGLLRGVFVTRGMIAVYGAVAALAAAPQVLYTVSGLLSGDPFLTYRVASNVNLGVVRWATVIASLPVLVPVVLLAVTAVRRRHRGALAISLGTLAAWSVLALNDVWGANAEPYRFWLDGYLLAGAAALVAGAALLARPPQGPLPTTLISRTARIAAATFCIALFAAASLPDLYRYQTDPMMSAVWDPSSSRESAIGEMGREASVREPHSLIAPDSCIDPRTTKITTAAPIAYFYLGMAWPERMEPVAQIMSAFQANNIDTRAMEEADAGWFLTDSACESAVNVIADSRFTQEATADYQDADSEGTVTLWRFSP